ncbi:hypothetical protein [Streptomonospora wellingtoniae]|uniref:PE-PGRS family protein n=1 Tax=Streptomonospora wellingtoniae TaxID=3075544 RepID=A0ABU2KUK8_9ACTN|nr:hypothetical protein [Streptomonospora sp. DSM 45055]MDT0302943.1 hypothetical protein [Streptomonospora sp. DSM 45055]
MTAARPDLDAIAAREQAATPGPWAYDGRTLWGRDEYGPIKAETPADRTFISHARADVPALLAENADTCRTLRTLLADPGDDLSGADLGELLEIAQATIGGLQVRADTNRAWAEDYRAQRDQLREQLEAGSDYDALLRDETDARIAAARREERERCAKAVAEADQLRPSTFPAIIRALPDEDTPTTEEG